MNDCLTSVADVPAETPPAPVVTQSTPGSVCYEARWGEQSVFISAPCHSVREWQWHCLATAILLERLEDACVLAETMLETSLQFFVSELPAECNELKDHATGYLRVLLTCSSDEVEILLPSGVHSNVAKHSKLIESSNLRWSNVSASIKIAHIALNESDVAKLQQGALILIPESWQAQWLCTIDVPQLERSIVATMNTCTNKIELDFAKSEQHVWPEPIPDQSIVTAYLDQTITIDPSSLLLGGQSGVDDSSSAISVSLAQASCHCYIKNDRFVADLAQIGAGFGLCIREYA